jgi:hypothetical protein
MYVFSSFEYILIVVFQLFRKYQLTLEMYCGLHFQFRLIFFYDGQKRNSTVFRYFQNVKHLFVAIVKKKK